VHREDRYYIVVSAARSPISCVVCVLLVGALGAGRHVAGQSPEFQPLLPADEAWQVSLPDLPSAGGAMDASRVYVPLVSHELLALDRRSGARVWSVALSTALPPVVRDDTLYVAAAGALHALDASTGRERWARSTSPAAAAMLVTADLVIMPVRPGGLVAVRRTDGQPVWTQALDDRLAISLASDGETIYVAQPGGEITAVALENGQLRWRQSIDGEPGVPALAIDRVLIGTSSNLLYALDPRTGRTHWRYTLAGSVVGAVATEDRVHVAALDNLLRAFNRGNGHQRWRQALATRPLAPPRIVGEEIVVTGVDPALSTFLLATGAPAATWAAPEQSLLQGTPLIEPVEDPAAVHVVVVLRDGRVIGLRRPDPGGAPGSDGD
jgi:outer membrane protein assembly factor BamB